MKIKENSAFSAAGLSMFILSMFIQTMLFFVKQADDFRCELQESLVVLLFGSLLTQYLPSFLVLHY
jgi:hypothetical protein